MARTLLSFAVYRGGLVYGLGGWVVGCVVTVRLSDGQEVAVRARLGVASGSLGRVVKAFLLEGVDVAAPAGRSGAMSDAEMLELGKGYLARSHAGGKLTAAEASIAARVPFRERPGFVERPPLRREG